MAKLTGRELAALGADARRKYDWPTVRIAFTEGRVDDKGERTWPTLKDCADLFGVPYNRVREHSAKERWKDLRASFQANVERIRREKRATELSREAVELDAKALQVSKMGIQLVQMRMGQIAQAAGAQAKAKKEYEDWVKTGRNGEPPEYDDLAPSPLDAREMATLASAVQLWHTLGCKALGEVETKRTELTGANGAPLEVRQDIRGELTRDDPQRLHALLVAVERSGLLDVDAPPPSGPHALPGPGQGTLQEPA